MRRLIVIAMPNTSPPSQLSELVHAAADNPASAHTYARQAEELAAPLWAVAVTAQRLHDAEGAIAQLEPPQDAWHAYDEAREALWSALAAWRAVGRDTVPS
jgi:hypothetical protein